MDYLHSFKKNKGFSLVELLIVISIFGLFVYISDTTFVKFKNRSDIELDKNIVIQTVRRSQSNAQKNLYDSNWGVYFASTTLVVFRGDSYQTRDSIFDQRVNLTGGLIVQQEKDIIFNKTYGTLNTNQQIDFKDNTNAQIKLQINKFGILQYE